MNETALIIGEIILGIAFLGAVSAVITLLMVRKLPRGRSRAAEILDERYARGELSSEQYQQMRREVGIRADAEESLTFPSANGVDVVGAPSSRRPT